MAALEPLEFSPARESEPRLRVSELHAFSYCPRLLYLEEVEELYTQDAAMFAGRRLHVDLEKQENKGLNVWAILDSNQ
jgi:CRISP-associated protein Cas1